MRLDEFLRDPEAAPRQVRGQQLIPLADAHQKADEYKQLGILKDPRGDKVGACMGDGIMMIDVQCKCGKRFGWAGHFVDRPSCPRCGDRPPQAELEAMDQRMDADRERMATDPMRATLEQLKQQRIDAGLTLRQAAKLLLVMPSCLSDTEQGRTPLSDELAKRMRAIYGVGQSADHEF